MMSARPWDEWAPGVLNQKQIRKLLDAEVIRTSIDRDVFKSDQGPSSFDLHITDEGYELLEGTIKPTPGGNYEEDYLQNTRFAERKSLDSDGSFQLNRGTAYVFRLAESLPGIRGTKFYGHATGKSSIGRVDVLARLVVDGMDVYDSVDPDMVKGDLFVEVTPITFNILLRPGDALNQLRIIYGDPKYSIITENKEIEIYADTTLNNKIKFNILRVNLENEIVGGIPVAAFRAKNIDDFDPNTNPSLDISTGSDKIDPCLYWDLRPSVKGPVLTIRRDRFYILQSVEKILLPPLVAVYCRAMNEAMGEMRIHYAGFVHPYFGSESEDGLGTPLIFEVRGHSVDVTLRHEEKLAEIDYYRMSDKPDPQPTPYDKQTLKLSKFFSEWPDKLIPIGDEGAVRGSV